MPRPIRGILFATFVMIVGVVVARWIYATRLTPEQREKMRARIDEAVEAGKQAAEQKRERLEDRLEQLVGENGKHA
ncbi:MAG: hypothetical protein IT298_01195 [Chloroflexi bacterium]|jgi:Spy/CpxP family protein refolding chaperone|nr:hypothetical protein [Chloroflexota bacterium]OQY79316.1 MAG: hypothetical protein B6D42_15380 [Anaerolineae bacterium UTCFX5]